MNDRRQRDKGQTIQEVLNAATRLFSAKGLHGTSIRDIEKASGVSKGLIMHHFETKEKLYTAVQSNLIKEYTSWMAIHRDTSKDLIDLITTAIREALSYMRGNRDFRRIGLWSYLESKERTSELDKRFTNSLIQAMRAGQEAGLVRDDIDAFIFPFVVRGTIEDWIRRESLRGEIFEETQNNNEITDEDLVDALVKLMLK
jgi:AcrR family transcriptional regulator